MRRALWCAVSLAWLAPVAHGQSFLAYDAFKGTSPTDQCFDFSGEGSPGVVSNGTLLLGPTTDSSRPYWYKVSPQPLAFNTFFLAELEIYVVQSDYSANACGAGQRAGYYLGAAGPDGEYVLVGIGSSTVFLAHSGVCPPGPDAPAVNIAMAGVWRTVRLQVTAAGSELYIDNAKVLSMPRGGDKAFTPNSIYFGDMSLCGASQTKVSSALFSLPAPICPGDFNGDCFLDVYDFTDFVTCFEGGSCPDGASADFNRDGFADIYDFIDFVTAFELGCG